MQIRFIGGQAEVEARDILDPHFGSWKQSELKDVPDDLEIMVRPPGGGAPSKQSAQDAIFNCGRNFVDDATGINPLFQCADCQGPADSDFFRPDDESIEYADADGNRLCPECYLKANPKWFQYHYDRGYRPPTNAEPQATSEVAVSIPSPVVTEAADGFTSEG